MNLLTKYVIAMANLYGVIHKDQVIDTYNQQNEKHLPYINRIFLTAGILNPINRYRLKQNKIKYRHPYFQATNIITSSSDITDLITSQARQPRYQPEKEELQKYQDINYEQTQTAYQQMRKYIYNHFVILDHNDKVERLVNNLFTLAKTSMQADQIAPLIKQAEIKKRQLKDAYQLKPVIVELMLSVRTALCNGYTLREAETKPGIRIPAAGQLWLALGKEIRAAELRAKCLRIRKLNLLYSLQKPDKTHCKKSHQTYYTTKTLQLIKRYQIIPE